MMGNKPLSFRSEEEVGDSITLFGFHIPIDGSEDGDNSLSLRNRNETEQHTQPGMDEDASTIKNRDDTLLETSDLIRRFIEQTRLRLKPRTQEEYVRKFRRFARESNLDGRSKKQMAGHKGKELLLSYLERIPAASRRYEIAALKMVWDYGLELPWPIDSKRDLGRLPRVRRRESPPDSDVKEWKEALQHESDDYLRLIWLLIAQHGWRPSHVTRLKWRNVRYNAQGKPCSIIADGAQEGFKTNSPVAARLSAEVSATMDNLRKATDKTYPEHPIIPWRNAKGEIKPSREQDTGALRQHWKRMRKKWDLPPLRPSDMRHWVASACRRAGLSKQASAYLMGHDSAQGGAMRDWYDNPQIEDILAEQATILPNGPLGMLEPAGMEISDKYPSEALNLLSEYLEGKIGTMEMASQMERIRQNRLSREIPPIEP